MSDPIVYVPLEQPHEPQHWMPYGEAGVGKTEFLKWFPKPMLYQCFDPHGKDGPILRSGRATKLYLDESTKIPTRLVYHPTKDEVMIKCEYFLDLDPESPTVWKQYLRRMKEFAREWPNWATIAVDSITFAEMTARWASEFDVNKNNPDGRAHYGYSAKQLELNMLSRLAAVPINVVVLAHVEKDKDQMGGRALYNPLAPGQMSKKFPSGYGECYRLYTDTNSKRFLQSQPDGMYNAATQIGTKNNLELPDNVDLYELVWAHARKVAVA